MLQVKRLLAQNVDDLVCRLFYFEIYLANAGWL